MAKPLNICLIGYSFMGKAHSNAWLSAGKFFDLPVRPVLKVLVGRNRKAATAVAKRWGWEEVETDYRAAVTRDDVDLVDIGAPNNVHCEMALAALEAGKAVACEKPIAMNADEAKRMAAAARKAKVLNTVWFNYRRVPAVALARQLVQEGRIGDVHHVRAVYLQDWVMDPSFPLVWRLDKRVAGSGSHGDLNAHLIDTAQHITGDSIATVCALTKTFVKERPLASAQGSLSATRRRGGKTGRVTVDDAVLCLATFKGGAVGTFEATRFAKGHHNGNRIEINGSKGSLAFDFERMNELQFYDGGDPDHVQGFRTISATKGVHPYAGAYWPPGHVIGYEHTFINHAADIATAWAKGEAVAPTFADAARVQRVLDAVLESAKAKAWVKV